jgi:hypothetical protein
MITVAMATSVVMAGCVVMARAFVACRGIVVESAGNNSASCAAIINTRLP